MLELVGSLLVQFFFRQHCSKILISWAVVVAQLVERLLTTPEIRGSNPDIGKILSTNCTVEETKIKKKRPGMAHLLKDAHQPFKNKESIDLSSSTAAAAH